MALPTGVPTTHGIPKFAGADRPRLATSPGLGDILDTLDGLIGAYKIADTTLVGSVASIDFTSIPAIFAHLLLVAYTRSDRAATVVDGTLFRLNNDAGANYNQQIFQVNNAAVSGSTSLGNTSGRLGLNLAAAATANRFAAQQLLIPHYANALNHKTAFSLSHGSGDDTAGNQYVEINGTLWRSAAVINRLTLLPAAGANWVAGCRASLYGLP